MHQALVHSSMSMCWLSVGQFLVIILGQMGYMSFHSQALATPFSGPCTPEHAPLYQARASSLEISRMTYMFYVMLSGIFGTEAALTLVGSLSVLRNQMERTEVFPTKCPLENSGGKPGGPH